VACHESISICTLIKESMMPNAIESRPIKIMTRERLFLLSLESAIFLEKYNGKFKLMGLSFKIKNLLLITLIFLGINSLKSQEKKTDFKTGADRHELDRKSTRL